MAYSKGDGEEAHALKSSGRVGGQIGLGYGLTLDSSQLLS